MDAKFPETECICPAWEGMWRAHQVVIVPESLVTMALEGNRFPNWWAITWGFNGMLSSVARVCISSFQFFMLD